MLLIKRISSARPGHLEGGQKDSGKVAHRILMWVSRFLLTVGILGTAGGAVSACAQQGGSATLRPTRPAATANPTKAPQTTWETLLVNHDVGALLIANPSALTPQQRQEQLKVKQRVDAAIKDTEFDMLEYIPGYGAYDHKWTDPTHPIIKEPWGVYASESGYAFELHFLAAIKLPGSNPNGDGTTIINGKSFWEYAVKRLNQVTKAYEYRIILVGQDNVANNENADPSQVQGLNKILVETAYLDGSGKGDPSVVPSVKGSNLRWTSERIYCWRQLLCRNFGILFFKR